MWQKSEIPLRLLQAKLNSDFFLLDLGFMLLHNIKLLPKIKLKAVKWDKCQKENVALQRLPEMYI